MKKPFFIFLVLSTWIHFAQAVSLPPVIIHQDMIGGEVLLIGMKDYVTLKSTESEALVKELGLETKNKFVRDMIMSRSPLELELEYDSEDAHIMVRTVISRYAIALENSQMRELKAQKALN